MVHNVKKNPWRFDDPPNTICYTTCFVIEGSCIVRVTRDIEGDWQVHDARSCNGEANEDDFRIVALSEIVALDSSIEELASMKLGWSASRKSNADAWCLAKQHPFPDFVTNGFYLENAEWLAEAWEDMVVPNDKELEGISKEDYVKLAFRFASESSEQLDGQYESMWVRIAERDEDWCVGILDNDPHLKSHRKILKSGDEVVFHLCQIIEVYAED